MYLEFQMDTASSPGSWLLWFILLTASFIILTMLSEQIQLWRLSYSIGSLLSFLNRVLTTAFQSVVCSIEQHIRSRSRATISRAEIESRVRDLMEYVLIEPTSLETQGLVRKLKHVIWTYDERLEASVTNMMPSTERHVVQNFVNVMEVLRALNYVYKVVNHYYRLALKHRNPYPLAQIYILMPFIKETISALSSSIDAIIKGQPIGDSVGPYVAYKFIKESCKSVEEVRHTIKDTYIAKCVYDGRIVYVVKALGPGGTVGRLDDAVIYLIDRMGVRPKVLITVDASLKLEGEKTGSIADGVGVAIGGIGVEKFNIETIATTYGIPLYAILIKMGFREALTSMTSEIADAASVAVRKVGDVVRTYAKEGEEVILIGVGNTIGIGQ